MYSPLNPTTQSVFIDVDDNMGVAASSNHIWSRIKKPCFFGSSRSPKKGSPEFVAKLAKLTKTIKKTEGIVDQETHAKLWCKFISAVEPDENAKVTMVLRKLAVFNAHDNPAVQKEKLRELVEAYEAQQHVDFRKEMRQLYFALKEKYYRTRMVQGCLNFFDILDSPDQEYKAAKLREFYSPDEADARTRAHNQLLAELKAFQPSPGRQRSQLNLDRHGSQLCLLRQDSQPSVGRPSWLKSSVTKRQPKSRGAF